MFSKKQFSIEIWVIRQWNTTKPSNTTFRKDRHLQKFLIWFQWQKSVFTTFKTIYILCVGLADWLTDYNSCLSIIFVYGLYNDINSDAHW